MDVREAADGADVNFNKKNFTYNTNITDMLQTWQNLLESDKKFWDYFSVLFSATYICQQ